MRIRDRELDWCRLGPFALAFVAYVPLLLTRRGMVVADTKQYLFLDPGGVLAASGSLWDPDWAMGTVTHQSVGYLWPMGPWFWFWETVGAPDWIAQRLWIGTILFAAGMGMLGLGRVFGWRRSAALVGAFVYLLSPYPLAYATRISVLVLPWAALPWLVALGIRALRRGGWREPALIALIGTTVGSVNASSLIFAGLAVVLWFPLAAWLFREVSTRTMLTTAVRIGAALIGACLWWAVALVVQGRHGADVLQFSETLSAVASGSPASEAWRGLGYWVLYGSDRAGPWVTAGEVLTQNPVVMAATFAMATVSVAALLLTRSRYRAYLLLLTVTGVSLTIGFHPYESPGTVLALVRDDVADTGLALALRSSPRALPLFLLAAAAALAGAVDALPVVRQRAWAGAAIVVLAAIGAPPLWTGGYVGAELARDEAIRPAWSAAAAHLDAGDPNHRAIILPGADFSTHRWGNTIDHILPGLTDRPVAVRELVSYGPAPSGDLLIALDRRAQESLFEPSVVAPIARLMGAGDVIVQNDLEFERYRVPRPDGYWAAISRADGFDEITEFGPRVANEPSPDLPMVDAIELTMPPDLPDPPAVAALGVADPLGVLRTRAAIGPLVVAGDGESLIDVAEAGLLDPGRVVLYEAALTDEQFLAALAAGGELVITDGNRLEARRWKTVRDNRGMTEQFGGDGLRPDPSDARLGVFENASMEAFTTARQEGLRVTATAYGNAIAFHSEDRAAHAIDGDITTAWRVAAFADARGESLRIEFTEPVDADEVTLVQPVTLDRNRYITELDVIVDDEDAVRHRLDDRSLDGPGQTIPLGVDRLETIEFRVWETSSGRRVGYGGDSAVGFAEVLIGDARVDEVIVLPTTPARRAAGFEGSPPTTVLFSRERATERRDDPETRLHREFSLAVPAAFELGGIGRFASFADDETAASAVGIVAPPFATASDRLTRDTFQAPWVAVDGDRATVWSTSFGPSEGQWLELDLGPALEVEEFSLAVIADGRHSVPTVIDVGTDAGVERVALPSIDDRSTENAVTDVSVAIRPVVTSRLRVTVVESRPVTTVDWFSLASVETPVGIAEVTVPGVAPNPPTPEVLADCRSDLLWIDDEPVAIRLVPSSRSATGGYDVESCQGAIGLGAGPHRLRTTAGRVSGIDLDLLILRSTGERVVPPNPPTLTIESHGRGVATVAFSEAVEPFWLVLGESYEPGWEAVLDGVDLGPPTLVDGFANGWLVDPAATGPIGTVELAWGPNRAVRFGFVGSVLVFAVLGLLAWRRPGGFVSDPPAPTRLGPAPWLVDTLGLRVALAMVVAVTVAAGTRPWIGLVVGVAVFFAPAKGGGVWVLPALGLGALGAAGAYVVLLQMRYQGPLDGAWPSLWGRPHLLGWITLGVVVGELVLESLRASRAGRASPARPSDGSG